MQRNSLLLVAAATLLAGVSAQTAQTGLYYWCSFFEGGSNFAAASALQTPRTTLAGLPLYTTYSSPCHYPYRNTATFQFDASNSNSLTYSNGSAYPTNTVTSMYAISPSSCLVRTRPLLTFS